MTSLLGRIWLSPPERVAVAALSAFGAIINPERGDLVATLGETTGRFALQKMQSKMLADPVGRSILADRPRVTEDSINLPTLRALPPHTFGAAYAKYIDSHGFSPDGRAEVRFIDDPQLQYVMQRYREIHDFLHALSGLEPSVVGELALKWFELVQTELPLCALASLVGPLRLPPSQFVRLMRVGVPWAATNGANAACMMNVRFEDHFETDVGLLRKQLRLEPAPLL